MKISKQKKPYCGVDSQDVRHFGAHRNEQGRCHKKMVRRKRTETMHQGPMLIGDSPGLGHLNMSWLLFRLFFTQRLTRRHGNLFSGAANMMTVTGSHATNGRRRVTAFRRLFFNGL